MTRREKWTLWIGVSFIALMLPINLVVAVAGTNGWTLTGWQWSVAAQPLAIILSAGVILLAAVVVWRTIREQLSHHDGRIRAEHALEQHRLNVMRELSRDERDRDSQRLDVDRERLRTQRVADEERCLRDRFHTLVGLLSSENTRCREGAAFATVVLADDWKAHYEQRGDHAKARAEQQLCVDLLISQLREPCAGDGTDAPDLVAFKHTVQNLIISRLGGPALTESDVSRSATGGPWSDFDLVFDDCYFHDVDFAHVVVRSAQVHFIRAHFTGSVASFYMADLSGRVEFRQATINTEMALFNGARFAGSRVSFGRTQFQGDLVSFKGARFSGNRVSFDGARFAGNRVSFHGAHFTSPMTSFYGAEFRGELASFAKARFVGALASFGGSDFGSHSVTFAGAHLDCDSGAFDSAQFTGSQVAFTGAHFTGKKVSLAVARFSADRVVFDDVVATLGEGVIPLSLGDDSSTTFSATGARCEVAPDQLSGCAECAEIASVKAQRSGELVATSRREVLA